MPITSISSYITTSEAFLINWNAANQELGRSGELLLAGGYGLALFTGDRTAMLAAMDTVADKASEARVASAQRESNKAALLLWAKQFRLGVQSLITDKLYLDALVPAPRGSLDVPRFVLPLRELARLWERINANATALGLKDPLTTPSGDLAAFEAAIDALIASDNATRAADEQTSMARSQRDTLMAALYERMKQYRLRAQAILPPTSPVLATLPRLSPPPGTTPPPLDVTGVWDAQVLAAKLSWPTTTDATVNKIQVRGCTGATYKGSEEEIVADLAADATEWSGDWGLTVAGAIASFKVYAMTTTGNENGGRAVKIVRPIT